MNKIDAAILHGKPPQARYENPDMPKPHKANWLPWLGSELAKRGLHTVIPQFPRPYFPEYEAYSAEFNQYHVNDGVVVAHSAGSEFILRWLSENRDVALRQLLLVAPWTDSGNKYGEFSNYSLDENLANRIGRITIINSLDDSQAIQDNVARLRSLIVPAKYIEFKEYGHFMLGNNMKDAAFPELLQEID